MVQTFLALLLMVYIIAGAGLVVYGIKKTLDLAREYNIKALIYGYD